MKRGHKASDSSCKEVAKLLHCRLCEERKFIEHQLAPDGKDKANVFLSSYAQGKKYIINFSNIQIDKIRKVYAAVKKEKKKKALKHSAGVKNNFV